MTLTIDFDNQNKNNRMVTISSVKYDIWCMRYVKNIQASAKFGLHPANARG